MFFSIKNCFSILIFSDALQFPPWTHLTDLPHRCCRFCCLRRGLNVSSRHMTDCQAWAGIPGWRSDARPPPGQNNWNDGRDNLDETRQRVGQLGGYSNCASLLFSLDVLFFWMSKNFIFNLTWKAPNHCMLSRRLFSKELQIIASPQKFWLCLCYKIIVHIILIQGMNSSKFESKNLSKITQFLSYCFLRQLNSRLLTAQMQPEHW